MDRSIENVGGASWSKSRRGRLPEFGHLLEEEAATLHVDAAYHEGELPADLETQGKVISLFIPRFHSTHPSPINGHGFASTQGESGKQ